MLSAGYVPLRTPGKGLVEPGDMTKFMSVPWHTDYNSCATHPTSPTIPHNTTLYWSWPAQRPVNVHLASEVTAGATRFAALLGSGSPAPAAQTGEPGPLPGYQGHPAQLAQDRLRDPGHRDRRRPQQPGPVLRSAERTDGYPMRPVSPWPMNDKGTSCRLRCVTMAGKHDMRS